VVSNWGFALPHVSSFTSVQTLKLPTLFVVMSLLLGMIHHFLQQKIRCLPSDNPYAEGFSIIGFVLPIIVLITLFSFASVTSMDLSHTVIGLSALGLFIVSIYQNRAPR
jgi:hypothetical protein